MSLEQAWDREAAETRNRFEFLRAAWAPTPPSWLVPPPGRTLPATLDFYDEVELPADTSTPPRRRFDADAEVGPWYDVDAATVFSAFDWRTPEEQRGKPAATSRQEPEATPSNAASKLGDVASQGDMPRTTVSAPGNGPPSSLPLADSEPTTSGGEGQTPVADVFADFDWK